MDPSTGSVVATVPVGFGPQTVAYDPANHDVYVASAASISVISPDNQVVATIKSLDAPTYMIYNPVNQEIYVTQSNPPYGIAVINAVTNSLVTTIRIEAFSATFDPANGNIYAGVYTNVDAVVSVIDPTNHIVAQVSLGHGNFDSLNGEDLAYDPANGNIFAATNPGTSGPNVVSEISSATNQVVGSLPIPSFCEGGGCYDIGSLTYNPANEDFYVSGPGPFVYIVTSSLTLSQKIPLKVLMSQNSQNFPNREIYDPANGDVYVLCTNFATIVIPITS
jgi:DNA-binding beta-propeller fold protein YncE